MTAPGWSTETLRWGLGGAVALALHAGAAYWLYNALKYEDVYGIAEAVEIDLAPAPVPPALAQGDAEAVPSDQPEAVPEPEPEPEAEPQPEPEPVAGETAAPDFVAPPLTELPPITDFSDLLPESALLLAASERPAPRPLRRAAEPEPQPQQTRRAEPQAQPRREQPQQQAAERPRQQPPASRQGAAQGQQRASGGQQGSPQADPRQQANWQARVQQRIASHMLRTRVPGVRGATVTANIRVTIAASGAAAGQLVSSTGNGQVDQALARQAARMPNMPAPPNGQSVTFVQPARIQLR